MSEVLLLEWKWIDFANKRVVWPGSKSGKRSVNFAMRRLMKKPTMKCGTGGMSKPLSAEALQLLKDAPRYARSRYVITALFDGSQAMTKNTSWAGWKRILERAELPTAAPTQSGIVRRPTSPTPASR